MNYLALFQIISIYGIIFFVFLSVAMASQPQHFQFLVNDEIINTCIIVTALYGVVLFVVSIMIYWRKRTLLARGVQGRKLMTEEEERNTDKNIVF